MNSYEIASALLPPHMIFGSGRHPILLLCGFQAEHTCWRAVQHRLGKRFVTVAANNEGAGPTAFHDKALTIERMAENAISFMRHLGHERFFLAGHSMGGAIAQVIAHRYPEFIRGLALCNTFRRVEASSLAFLTNILKSLESGLDPILARQRLLTNIFSPSTLQKAARDAIAENQVRQQTGEVEGFRRQLEALSFFDSRNWIGEIQVPAQIINSANDRPFFMSEAAIMSSDIKNARSILLPGGHASMIEQPRLMADALMSFFSDC